MTYHMYFIQTLIKRCIVSEILAEIDHKGPKWTFLIIDTTSHPVKALLDYSRV